MLDGELMHTELQEWCLRLVSAHHGVITPAPWRWLMPTQDTAYIRINGFQRSIIFIIDLNFISLSYPQFWGKSITIDLFEGRNYYEEQQMY